MSWTTLSPIEKAAYVVGVFLIAMIVFMAAGCNGVVLNAEYSDLLDRTTALSAETANRAEDGQLTPEQMTSHLVKQAGVWQRFKDARDGVK